jgi:hypothetical protein
MSNAHHLSPSHFTRKKARVNWYQHKLFFISFTSVSAEISLRAFFCSWNGLFGEVKCLARANFMFRLVGWCLTHIIFHQTISREKMRAQSDISTNCPSYNLLPFPRIILGTHFSCEIVWWSQVTCEHVETCYWFHSFGLTHITFIKPFSREKNAMRATEVILSAKTEVNEIMNSIALNSAWIFSWNQVVTNR